ncbi:MULTISPECIES: hypothetical protein [Aeromonas]|uniref:hypothetical protein n=1 Tax=Aeromonas TaxID=642 RepID=UPI00084D52B3|nr:MULTISPECIES: hypothetical protein [Aeromonas]MCF3099792.1 hypothetical protein [Aeromonas australiensis]MDH1847448.1 hypothetical protein [Aeromonas caviae]OEG03956.1 hypothetical protein BFW25_10070 [Aeromonas caviae]PPA30822.1 hypothetical protein C3737_01055 [Aeromonas jandaei]WOQ14327.1 hypothetical protein R2X36_05555 [Aeromonas media]
MTVKLSDNVVSKTGDNQFLTHITRQIELREKVIGHLKYTIYNFGAAFELNTARAWLVREDNYIGRLHKYLLDDQHKIATLSEFISSGLIGPEQCVIIDDVVMNAPYRYIGTELRMIRELLTQCEMKFSFAMLPNWRSFCDWLGINDEYKTEELGKLGFYPLDDYLAFRYLDDEMLNMLINESVVV